MAREGLGKFAVAREQPKVKPRRILRTFCPVRGCMQSGCDEVRIGRPCELWNPRPIAARVVMDEILKWNAFHSVLFRTCRNEPDLVGKRISEPFCIGRPLKIPAPPTV